MKIALWIVQGLLAAAFIMGGAMKVMTPYTDLIADPNMGWAKDYSAGFIQFIGISEILGGIGLIVPMFVPRFRFLVPLAAVGLLIVMIAAAVVHIGRGEPIIPNIVLGLLAAFVIWGRRDFFSSNS